MGNRVLYGSIAFALAAVALATPQLGQAQTGAQPVEQASHHCNTGVAAAIGGLLGAFAGRGKGHLVGAAVGAGIGALACTAFNYHERQLQTAQQVDAEYQQQHGSLPSAATVTAFTTTLEPQGAVPTGASVTVTSMVTIVAGSDGAPPPVSQEIALISPSGKVVNTAEKASTNAGGQYQTSFNFTLPKGIPDGDYAVRTEVLLNGQVQRTNNTPMQVVAS